MIFYFIDDLGVSPQNLTILYTVISLSILIFAVPCGRLVDKYGRKKPILFSWILRALLYTLLINSNFGVLLIIRPLIALANIVLNSAKSSLIADYTPQEHRGKIAGSRDFFILVTSSFGSILGGYIYNTVSHTLSISIMIAFSILLFILTYFFVKEPIIEADD